ncbi:hypothetical protein HPB52_016842 [Rhipicephalus sanguineus]|uniref:Uncharacterized protein n=1 Tax=Rhipicephalus sanguineus TaxID=34632 RepID=A0A9D4PWU7_RHISA|nr:hypothetical protein HPB52_016842 [Rhipicephalus sanguineus]
MFGARAGYKCELEPSLWCRRTSSRYSRQLFEFTDQLWFLKGRSANDACYEHVNKVMKLAITSHHFQSEGACDDTAPKADEQIDMKGVEQADDKVGAGFVLGDFRDDDDDVRELDESFPDVPLGRLFPTWIKYRSLNAHLAWKDQKTILYDETDVNAYYSPSQEALVIPTSIMTRPFLYLYGPIALNYGGLGMLSLSRQEEKLDDTTDSENLSDLVGTMVAYAAYSSLPEKYKSETLAGLNTSSEQLFFISHCLKCYERGKPITGVNDAKMTQNIQLEKRRPSVRVAKTTLT